MSYLHVVVTFQSGPGKQRCLFSDLSSSELRKQFVRPYRRGRTILCDREVIDLAQVKTVAIVQTERPKDDELTSIQEKSRREIEEFNRSTTSLVLVSAGRGYDSEDIVEAGEDVTADYIDGPPGRLPLMSAAVNHPWTLTVLGGLVVAALAWWLGWN